MWARFKAAWRTPVPPLVKVVAIAAVWVVYWVVGRKLMVGLPPPVDLVGGFALGCTTVLVVLLGWQTIKRIR